VKRWIIVSAVILISFEVYTRIVSVFSMLVLKVGCVMHMVVHMVVHMVMHMRGIMLLKGRFFHATAGLNKIDVIGVTLLVLLQMPFKGFFIIPRLVLMRIFMRIFIRIFMCILHVGKQTITVAQCRRRVVTMIALVDVHLLLVISAVRRRVHVVFVIRVSL